MAARISDAGAKGRIRAYVDLLVEGARRQTLLSSDTLERKLHLVRSDLLSSPSIRAIFSSRPLNVLVGTRWFLILSFIMWCVCVFCFFQAEFSGQNLFASMMQGGSWGGYVKESGTEQVFFLQIRDGRNCSMRSGEAKPGFGLMERTSSMVSHCKRRETAPILAWDPTSDCSRLTLTYEPGLAPDSIFGFFVIPRAASMGSGTAPVPDDEVEYTFGQRLKDRDVTFSPGGEAYEFKSSRGGVHGSSSNVLEFQLALNWPVYSQVLFTWVWLSFFFTGAIILFFTNATRFSHTLFCTTFFGISLANFASFIGDLTLEVPTMKYDQQTSNFRQSCLALSITYSVFGVALTLLPRHPDVLMILLCITLHILRSSMFFWNNSRPFGVPNFVALALATMVTCYRVLIWWTSKLYAHKIAKKYDEIWYEILASSDLVSDQLARLEGVVAEMEMSIPNGTVARQCNLKACLVDADRSRGKRVLSFFTGKSRERRGGAKSSGQGNGEGRGRGRDLDRVDEIVSSREVLGVASRVDDGEGGAGIRARGVSNCIRAPFTKASDLPNASVDLSKDRVKSRVDIEQMLMEDVWAKSMICMESQGIESSLERLPFEAVAGAVCSNAYEFVNDPSSPLRSVDQLWTQAILLRGFLLPKVLDLADRFGGVFPVRDEVGVFEGCAGRVWVPYKDRLRMGGIKNPERGIEKIDSAYAGDISRLLDVCRERIVFDSVEEMTDCLKALKEDPDVSIVRVKSNMTRPGINPYVPTGLRFISLNLRIQTPQTTRLAVHWHICEVIFILKRFAEVVTPEAHNAYIGHRNAMSVSDATLNTESFAYYLISLPLGWLWAASASLTTGFAPRNAIQPERSEQAVVTPQQTSPAADKNRILLHSPGGNKEDEEDQDSAFHLEGPVETSWGVSLQESDVKKLECVCRLGSLGITTLLDRKVRDARHSNGLGKAWVMSMFFTPNAAAIIFARPWVQLVCIIWGIMFVAANALRMNGGARSSPSVESFQHFKYTSLADRQGSSIPPSTPGVEDFGVLHEVHGNCNRFDAAVETFDSHPKDKYGNVSRTVFRDGNSMIVSFSSRVPFTGWFLESQVGGANTSNFVVHASNHAANIDGDAESASTSIPPNAWKLVGTPSWGSSFLGSSTVDEFSVRRKFAMPTSYEVTLFEPTAFTQYSLIPMPSLGYAISGILPVIFARLGKGKWVRFASAFGIGVALSLEIIWIAKTSQIGTAHEKPWFAVSRGLMVFGTIALIIGVLLEGHKNAWLMIIWLHLCATARLLAFVFDSFGEDSLGGAVGFQGKITGYYSEVPVVTIGLWLFMFLAKMSRSLGTWQARRLVRKDMEAYNELWKQEVERDTGQCSLNHLGRVVQMLGLDEVDSKAPLHQIGRKFLVIDKGLAPRAKKTDIAPELTREKCLGDDSLFELLNCMSVPYSLDKLNVVRSCDQLFVQAILVHGILRDKIGTWAMQSQGYFAVSPDKIPPSTEAPSAVGNHFVKWADAMDDSEMCRKVKWPVLKKSSRMMEKLMRVYQGDASRIADIVRFSIFFDTFTDLTQALGCIVTDFDVKVERVKSRLSLKHDGNATAGYRDVMLNLRVVTKEVAMLGCDTHLCEVQLVLKSFGELKTAQGHARYVMFRDLRVE